MNKGENINEWSGELLMKDLVLYEVIPEESAVDHFVAPDAFVLLFFETGSGTHLIDFTGYDLAGGQVRISYPMQVHSWNARECVGHKLILNKYFVERFMFEAKFLFEQTNQHPVLSFDKKTFELLLTDVKILALTFSKEEIDWQAIILRTMLVCTTIDQFIKKKFKDPLAKHNRIHPVLEAFMLLIEQHFSSEKSVSFYADQLFVSPNYLTVLCRRYWGTNTKEIIYKRIVQEAKRKLVMESLSIKEIANLLGFSDTAHFSGFLKLRTGFSPKQFRAKYH